MTLADKIRSFGIPAVPALVLVAGLMLSGLAFWAAQSIEGERAQHVMELRAEWRARDMEDKINDAAVPVEALADFIGSQKEIDPEEFHRFAIQARGDDPVALLSWAPLVKRNNRTTFEAKARQADSTGYAISESDANGKLHPATERDEYLPTRFVERFDNKPGNVGFDLLSEKNRAAIIAEARDSGEPMAAPPVHLLSDPTGTPNYVVYWPIYSTGIVPATKAERHDAFSGIVTGPYPVDKMLNFAIRNSREDVATLSLFIDHPASEPYGVPMAIYHPENKQVAIPQEALGPPPAGVVRLIRTFPQFGHEWTLVSDYPPAIASGFRSSAPWAYLALGLLLTLGIPAYMVAERRRRQVVESEVEERTKELRASSEQIKAILDASPVAIVAFDAARNVTSWNSAAEQSFGFSASEIVGHQVTPLFVPDGAESDGRFDRIEAGENLAGLETKLRHKDGAIINTISSVASFFDSAGALKGTVAVIVDVTESRVADAKLRETQMLLAGIVSLSEDAMISKTLDGIVTSWNRAAEHIFGYSAEEMIGKPISVLAVPGRENEMVEILARIGRGEHVDPYETQRRRKDGAIIDVSTTAAPIHDAAERIIGVSKIARDITAAKQERRARDSAEALLRESEQKYRTTFDIAPVGIVHMTLGGRFLMVNEFYCKLLGYERAELLSMNVVDVTDQEYAEQTKVTLEKARGGRASQGVVEKRHVRKDGTCVWVEVNFTEQHDETTQQPYIISIINDITAKKLGDEKQLQLSVQLQQAQKMESIGQLTGGLAHDFNNLLAVVLGNLDFLEDKFAAGSDERNLTEAAIKAALHGAELTRALLAFSRRQPLAPKLINLAESLTSTGQLLRRMLGENVTLNIKLDDQLWPVLIDMSQLESTILNLSVNARDAMPSGGILTIEAQNVTLDEGADELNPEAAPGDYLVISVSDTGTGMSPEVMAKVFEPFFTTKGTKGTGLGLSMVHGFVKQSGGHTRIYSEIGKGSTIKIYLPRAHIAAIDETNDAMSHEIVTGHESVLVVEDNEGLREVAVRRLKNLGYLTMAAGDASEALDIIKSGVPVDLLFTDVVMPGGMDGRALADAACQLLPNLKVLFTSGFTAAAASAVLADKFSSNLLTKPYRKDELAHHVRTTLDEAA